MKKTYPFIITIVTLIIVIVACSKSSNGNGGDPPPPPPPPPSTCGSVSAKFASDVNPIIQNSCALGGCHGIGSTNGVGPLITFDQIKNAASRIKTQVVNRSMPLGSSLSNGQIQAISCWVDNGALNN